MTDLGDLAFHVQYGLKEVTCAEAGCDVVHRTHSGEATLTLAGPAQLIREAAALVFPGLAKVFNPPSAMIDCKTCGANVTPTKVGDDRCPDCIRERWEPLPLEGGKALSAGELDCLAPGMRVIAGAFPDEQRLNRILWVKLHSGRWETARQERVDDNAGVSSIWLANNRHPMLDTSS